MRTNVLMKIFLIILCVTGLSFAQSKTGTTIGQFLKIEPSARIAALGNAGSSVSGEAAGVFFNPAGLGRLQGVSMQFTNNQWLADIMYNYAVVAVNFDQMGTFALQMTSLNSGEIDVTTVEQPLGTGERYTVTNFALGISYGLMLTDRVSVGATVNYINEVIWHTSLSTFGLNFGVQYEVYENGPRFGASVSNFGPSAQYSGRDLYIDFDFDPKKYGDNDKLPSELRTEEYSLPTTFRAGVVFPLNFDDQYKMLISADALHPNDNEESINIGAELQLLQSFALRGGYRNLFLPDLEGGLTLGAGVHFRVLSSYSLYFDYGWSDYGRLKSAHRISFALNL